MSGEMNVNTNNSIKLKNYYDSSSTTINGKNKYLKGNYAEVSMFARGKDKDSSWYFDDGKLIISKNDGTTEKKKFLEFDKDGDGIADSKYKISTLQNGKAKERKVKYSSQKVNQTLADIQNIHDPEKKQRKLDKLKAKLLESGYSQEIIDKKLDVSGVSKEIMEKSTLSLDEEFKKRQPIFLAKTTELKEFKPTVPLPKKVEDKDSSDYHWAKFDKYIDVLEQEDANKREAVRLWKDPNLQEYYKQNPHVLAALLRVINPNA